MTIKIFLSLYVIPLSFCVSPFLCLSLSPPVSSYLHCEWSTLEQLERDKRIHQKLKRFKIKYTQMRNLFQEVSRSNQFPS